MKIMTLKQALDHAAADVFCTRQKYGKDAWAFDQSVEYWTKRNLLADIEAGTTKDRDGQRSRFTAYDWAHVYEEMPHAVFHDFFRGDICNAAGRLLRVGSMPTAIVQRIRVKSDEHASPCAGSRELNFPVGSLRTKASK